MYGEQSGCKTTADKVVIKMRTMRSTDNKKVFMPTEYLSRQQIVSSFSRMTKLYRQGELKKPQPSLKEAHQELQIVNDIETEEVLEDEIQDSINECLEQIFTLENIEVGRFVFVAKSYGLPKSQHSTGQITAEHDDDEIGISFLVKSGKTFHWPHPIQEFSERKSNVHMVLPAPDIGRREHLTSRDVDLEKIEYCCTV